MNKSDRTLGKISQQRFLIDDGETAATVSNRTLRQLPRPIRKLSRSFTWLTVLICLFGGTLRFIELDKQGLWTDELYTWEITDRDLSSIWQAPRLEPHPPLYNVLMSGIRKFLSPTETNLRLLSVVAGLALIPALGYFLVRNHGRTAAVAGMLFVATSPVLVYYSQEARVYALSQLWVVASMLAVQKVKREQEPRAWLLYSIAAIVGIYLNYFLGVIVLAQMIWLGLQPKFFRQKGLYISLFLIAIAFLPLAPNAVASLSLNTQAFNQTGSTGQSIELASTYESMLIGDPRYVPRFARWAALGIFAIFSLASIAYLRDRSAFYLSAFALATISIFGLLPLLGFSPPFYQEKQFVALAPIAWALAAVGVSYMWRSRAKYSQAVVVILYTVWIVAAGLALRQYFGGDFLKSYEQTMVNFMVSEQSTEEPILIVGHLGTSGAFQYYAPDKQVWHFRNLDDSEPFWISQQHLEMFPLAPPEERCSLVDLQSSAAFWVIINTWWQDSAPLINSLEQTRAIEQINQIGIYQIYRVPASPSAGSDPLRCET